MSDQNASRNARAATHGVGLDRHKLGAARLWATDPRRFPYLATAIFATTILPSPGLAQDEGSDGVAVDERWRLYIDPEVVERWRVDELGALLVHHTGHLVRDHAGRARTLGVTEATSERWALAADAELNDDLADAGLVVPGDPVVPEDLGYERGRLAEEYFHRQAEDQDERASEKPTPDHGSGSHGQTRPWEDPSPQQPPGDGEDSDDGGGGDGPSLPPPPPQGLDPHEAELVRASVAQSILDAMRQGQGTVPSNWQRWAQQLLAPTVDWRRALAAEVRRGVQAVAGAVDYSYRRPSRRASSAPSFVLPALERPVPEVAVVCDTSGSMGDRELGRVLAEVEGLLSSIGLRKAGVRVLAVDAAVQAVRRVSSARQVELLGGGGTDMVAGIDAAAALRPRPAVLVVLTDGLTPWPAAPPRGIRVVIGLLASPFTASRLPSTPAWARVVRIDDAA